MILDPGENRRRREITRKVDLETTPLYVRAGAVIPMGPVKQYTAEPIDGPLTLWIHPAPTEHSRSTKTTGRASITARENSCGLISPGMIASDD